VRKQIKAKRGARETQHSVFIIERSFLKRSRLCGCGGCVGVGCVVWCVEEEIKSERREENNLGGATEPGLHPTVHINIPG